MKRLLALVVAVTVLVGWVVRPKPAKQPMNIVFIFADDMSPTLGCYGDSVAPTPTIDQLAREGVLFEHAFCAAPSCSPSRAAVLTGRYPHQLAEGTNLWSHLPSQYPNYVTLLEQAGYRVGLTGKGWGPGNFKAGGYAHNPAGPPFKSFDAFMEQHEKTKPFCFWLGPSDPHRPYDPALRTTIGLRPQYLTVPPYLPDSPEVRNDLLDYYAETARVELTVAEVLKKLRRTGTLTNTLIVVAGDNGLPFPRAKANLYDAGTRIPLIVYGGAFRGGKRIPNPINLIDLAATFIDLAGLPQPAGIEGKSLVRFTTGSLPASGPVFLERERHADVRSGNVGYPARAIRTTDFLYIQNLKPDRWPAGDPTPTRPADVPGGYGDIDNGPSKSFLLNHRAQYPVLASAATAKRPADELYDLKKDPDQLRNVAREPAYQQTKRALQAQLLAWRKQTNDPRLTTQGDVIDTYPYYNGDGTVKK